MLGGLSRWLRIIGYDTLYYADKDDVELRNEAKDDNRILVTRDVGLIQQANRWGVKTFLVQSDNTIEQLREIVKALNLNTVSSNETELEQKTVQAFEEYAQNAMEK